MSLRLVNWNVEWETLRSRRTPEILRRIDRHAPEVVCLTETHDGLLSQAGDTICSQPDYGYPIKEHRRKVILWSREPWQAVDDVGADSLPPGRFVSGVTQTSVGAVRVVGVCIPWFGSRTEARRKSERKRPWQDHEQYLTGLRDLLARDSVMRLIVMGDFNQIMGPGSRASEALQGALRDAFPRGMSIATAGLTFQGRGSIDHIAVGDDFAVESFGAISNAHDGRRLSDHFGVVAEISASRPRERGRPGPYSAGWPTAPDPNIAPISSPE